MAESGQLLEFARMGGRAVSVQRHAKKDLATGQSLFAVKLGKASGVTRGLMKQFCKEHGIDSPGVNYINIDKSAFKQWRAQHDC
jgi:hypothetical protein